MAEKLKSDYQYPYEMMPLLYAIIKSTMGNLNESQKLIYEGRSLHKVFITDSLSHAKSATSKSGSVSPITNINGKKRILEIPLSSEEPILKNVILRQWKEDRNYWSSKFQHSNKILEFKILTFIHWTNEKCFSIINAPFPRVSIGISMTIFRYK